jgi:hypothetical protein
MIDRPRPAAKKRDLTRATGLPRDQRLRRQRLCVINIVTGSGGASEYHFLDELEIQRQIAASERHIAETLSSLARLRNDRTDNAPEGVNEHAVRLEEQLEARLTGEQAALAQLRALAKRTAANEKGEKRLQADPPQSRTERLSFIGGSRDGEWFDVRPEIDSVEFPPIGIFLEPEASGHPVSNDAPEVYYRVPLAHFLLTDVFAPAGTPYMDVLRAAEVPPAELCDCAYCRDLTV